MVLSNNITPGMTLSINGRLYRVESSVKVTVPKGTAFIKAKLRDLSTNEVVEKNFKLNQNVKDVSLTERSLEYLYMEGKDYLFLDIGNLEQVLVPAEIIGNKINYLKEGIEVKGSFYGDTIFSIKLPMILELAVAKIEKEESATPMPNAMKVVILETGAAIEVPSYIGVNDVIKVNTETDEWIQRV